VSANNLEFVRTLLDLGMARTESFLADFFAQNLHKKWP
jgi:hypothetical protein